jgi:hypothetical protein
VVGALTLLVTSCVPPSTFPDGSVPQIAPLGANGVAFDGTDLWMCDIFGGQLLRIDPATGKILERIGPDLGITSPDDLVFAPDGSIIYTSPGTGVVGRIRRTGPVADRISVLAQMDVGVNPIALTPDGTAVVVGYGSGGVGRVDRIDLATGAVSIVTAGVPDLNGFSFGPDGALWAPVGGPLSAITGEGGVIRIDVEFGTVARLPLTFPNEPGVRGLRFPVAAKWTPDGRLLVAQGIGPGALYEVDAVTVESVRFSTVSSDFADNLVTLDDGRTFVSGFFTSLSVVDATGQSTPLPIGG